MPSSPSSPSEQVHVPGRLLTGLPPRLRLQPRFRLQPVPAVPGHRRGSAPGAVAAPGTGPGTGPVAGALRAVESFLLGGGQQTARRNAWAAVVADRQRAKDRREAEREIAALAGSERGEALGPR